jgi:hypothetical protein
MLSSKYVCTFGLSEDENRRVCQLIKNVNCSLITAGSGAELVASDFYAAVINVNRLDESARKELSAYYRDIDGNLTQMILISDGRCMRTQDLHAKVFSSFADADNEIGELLYKAYQKAKKSENTIRDYSLSLLLYQEIEACPGITTALLAEQTGAEHPAVRRYVEVLRVMGKVTAYRDADEVWRLKVC